MAEAVQSVEMETPRGRAIEQVRRLVTQALGEHRSRVFLVGSCARGETRQPSDIDVAIDLDQEAPNGLIPDIRVALEQSDIPFFVDVFDLRRLPQDYRCSLLEGAVEWT